jgi:hypothetical protein
MANRKQQTDKEVSESVQRVAEANAAPVAPKPKPSTKDFQINKKAKAAIAAPLHPRAKRDKVNRALELKGAAEEARMQGQKSSIEAQKELAKKRSETLAATANKPALRNTAQKAQAERAKTFVPDAPKNASIEGRVKKRLKDGNVKPLSTREAGVDLTGTGGQKLTNEEGQKLKSFGDYSGWKRKSTDPKITRKGRK